MTQHINGYKIIKNIVLWEESALKNRPVNAKISICSFALSCLVFCLIFPITKLWGILLIFALSFFVAFIVSKITNARDKQTNESKNEEVSFNVAGTKRASERLGKAKNEEKSFGPKTDLIVEESRSAISEMGRLYRTIENESIRYKINEIMRITDKITQDAIEDPSDIPQIKKFFSYYLPTTIKLLNAYDRMDSQGITGDNIYKSKQNIEEMLDVSIEAYKKRLDSLFENQALDIETDIDVMNQMLKREGLTYEAGKDFNIKANYLSPEKLEVSTLTVKPDTAAKTL